MAGGHPCPRGRLQASIADFREAGSASRTLSEMTWPRTLTGLPPPPKKQRFANTPGRDNPRERALRSALHRRGLRFRVHLRPLQSRVSVDIAFTRPKVAVFLDGCFWHGCPEHGTWPKTNTEFWRKKILRNIERDIDVGVALTKAGWQVVRIWEHTPLDQAVEIVAEAVQSRSPST